MRKGCIISCGAEIVPLIERGCAELGDVRITGRKDIFDQDAIELRLEGDGLPDDYGVGGSFFLRKDFHEDDPYWKKFLTAAVHGTKEMLSPRHISADVGNVSIRADRHGMGFTCEIDGQPVERLRSVTLRLEVDRPNTVTVEVLCDHRS